MKKIISILIVIILCINTFAVCAPDTPGSKLALSMEEAQKRLENYNTEIILMDRKIEILAREYKDALAKAKGAKVKPDSPESEIVRVKKEELLNWQRKLFELDNLKHDREERLKTLKAEAKRQYLELLTIQADIQNMQQEISSMEKKLGQLNVKKQYGQATDLDIKSMQVQRQQLLSEQNTLMRRLDGAQLTLKKTLGINLKQQITLLPVKIELKKFDDSNIEAAIPQAAAQGYEIKSQQKEIELLKLEHQLLLDYSGKTMYYDIWGLEKSISDGEIKLEDMKLDAEAKLWSSYYNLKNLEDNIALARLELDAAQIKLKITQQKTQLGKTNDTEELADRLAAAKQQYNLQNAINEYMLAAEEYSIQLAK